jgi:hypothetical protein
MAFEIFLKVSRPPLPDIHIPPPSPGAPPSPLLTLHYIYSIQVGRLKVLIPSQRGLVWPEDTGILAQ